MKLLSVAVVAFLCVSSTVGFKKPILVADDSAVEASTCPAGTIAYQADITQHHAWPHYWKRCVGSGHALLALREDYRQQLLAAHKDCGFEMVRFHGIFDDDMSAYQEDGQGNPIYSWFNADSIFDYLLSIGMKPLVELSFMPQLLASGNQTIFHYKGNITPPKNYTQWGELVRTFVQHLVDRYGLGEVSRWHFEIWNEPNCGFFTGTQAEYFQLLTVTSHAVKSVNKVLSVGGPATCQSGWLNETVAFCRANNVALDFVSTHEYPTDIQPVTRDVMLKVVTQARKEVGDLPLFYTEYNDGLYWPAYHDDPFAAAFAVFNIVELQGLPDIFSWWTFTDVFEEGGFNSMPFQGGFGIQTIHGVPKPSYRAFQLLHETGLRRITTTNTTAQSTVGTLVTHNNSHIHVLVYNHDVPGAPIKSEKVCISLTGINWSKDHSAVIRRIDDDHANPIKQWQAMGSPEYLDRHQIEVLKKASEMVAEPIAHVRGTNNEMIFTLAIPPQGVAAITFPM